MNSRYSTGETSLLEKIRSLKNRIAVLERTNQIGNAAIDTGALLVNNETTIRVQDDDGNDLIIVNGNENGSYPLIGFLNPLDPTNIFSLYARDITIDFPNQTAIEYAIQNWDPITESSGRIGFFLAWNLGIFCGHSDATTAYYEARDFSLYAGNSESYHYVGRFINDNNISSADALYNGGRSVTGVSSATITYPITFATSVAAIATMNNVGGAALSFTTTAESSASFTIAWTGTTAKDIYMNNPRI